MAAIVPTNGVLTFSATTQTYTKPTAGSSIDGARAGTLSPISVILTASAASHAILTDGDGAVMLDIYAAATTHQGLNNHYFAGIRPWKTPIQCTTLSGGGKRRIYV